MFYRKYKNGLIDIYISTKCEVVYINDSSIRNIWSISILCGACGIQSIDFDPRQTRAYVYNVNDVSIPFEEHLGRTGLMLEHTNNAFRLSRAYNATMDIGGWGMETRLYTAGMYYNIDIYGAAYT